MKIKWGNVFAFAILICLIILLLRLFTLVDRISPVLWPPYYVNDPAFGILALGLICVTIVAVVKIISGR
jgi:uncharacterized membrane protein YedE/YeeE